MDDKPRKNYRPIEKIPKVPKSAYQEMMKYLSNRRYRKSKA